MELELSLVPFTHKNFTGDLPVNCCKEIMCEQDLFKNTGMRSYNITSKLLEFCCVKAE